MATVKVKVRALAKGTLDVDQVVLKNGYRHDIFMFMISPFGTPDAEVIESEIIDTQEAAFKAAIEQREGLTIQNNPAYEDVKTDDGTEGDATADDGINEGTRYNWAAYGKLYEIV